MRQSFTKKPLSRQTQLISLKQNQGFRRQREKWSVLGEKEEFGRYGLYKQ